jgi:hypothetical protein
MLLGENWLKINFKTNIFHSDFSTTTMVVGFSASKPHNIGPI